METFLRAQGVALTGQGHAFGRTRLLDPAAADAAALVTTASRGAVTLGTEVVAVADGRFALDPGLPRGDGKGSR